MMSKTKFERQIPNSDKDQGYWFKKRKKKKEKLILYTKLPIEASKIKNNNNNGFYCKNENHEET